MSGRPSPFDLFLASLGTCAGFYALRFCQQREIDTEGLAGVRSAKAVAAGSWSLADGMSLATAGL